VRTAFQPAHPGWPEGTLNAMAQRWVALDVGGTLIEETRVWDVWSDILGVSRVDFEAALGTVIRGGRDHRDVFGVLGFPGWRSHYAAFNDRYGGFRTDDLYPDAMQAMSSLATDGYRIAVVANQPARRNAELRALGMAPEVMAMSEELRVAKPDPGFFAQALALMGGPDPADVAYVGDRVDNDVLPAMAAGMRAVWIRRGPWGMIQSLPPDAAPALVVDSLTELTERIDEAWST
jgi:HAD superfamily hydrolase (TIGR01549 family)